MFYTVYKITNTINGKYYIGMHQTRNLNDSYMGSGKLLQQAITKYGIDNFKKEILHIFDNEDDMRAKEKELVVICEDSYNLCEGGKGGFGYLNRSGKARRDGAILSDKTKQKISESKKGKKLSLETRKKISDNNACKRQEVRDRISETVKGRRKTEEHKQKLSEAAKQNQHLYSSTTCPHCNKRGAKNAMSRWHFDKCKMRVE